MFMKCPSLFLTKIILGHIKDIFLKIIILLYPHLVLNILSRLKVMFEKKKKENNVWLI